MKKIILCVVAYLFVGVLSIKALSSHHKSWLYEQSEERELGAAVIIFPFVVLFDGMNVATYELGVLIKKD